MTESKELRVPYGEMTAVALECQQCGAETLINLAKEPQRQVCEDDSPLSCGVCRAAMDSNLRSAVRSLARAWGSIKQAQHAVVHFHIRVDQGRGR